MKKNAFQPQFCKRASRPAKDYFFALIIIAISTVLISSFIRVLRSKSGPNELAIGNDATIKGEIDIKLVQAAALSGMNINDILELRKSVVLQNKELLQKPYVPFRPVFNLAADGLPWISIKKHYYYGFESGDNDGPSLESKLILNPLLLVAPEIWGISRWPKDGISWNKSVINETILGKFDFPYYCKPISLKWKPEEKRAQATYPLQYFIAELNKYITQPVKNSQLLFGLAAYNALDFGFHFIRINEDKTKNIFAPAAEGKLIANTDRIVSKNFYCPTPEPCNSMDISMPELRKMVIRSLPARLSLELFKNPPLSASEGQAADFYYDIMFE